MDNCLEWHQKRELNDNSVRVLVLAMINFVLNHYVFKYDKLADGTEIYKIIKDRLYEYVEIGNFIIQNFPKFKDRETMDILLMIQQSINTKRYDKDNQIKQSEEYYNNLSATFKQQKNLIKSIFMYGYKLEIEKNISQKIFQEINNLIESGILLKRGEA